MKPDYEYESKEEWAADIESEEVPSNVEYLNQTPMNQSISEEEYTKHPCPNCGTITIQPKWLVEKYEKEGDAVYCSEACCYNAETGHPGEEY